MWRSPLTDNAEKHGVRDERLCGDLTLVQAGVLPLGEPYHERPVVPGGVAGHLEAGVVCVRVRAGGEDVQVPTADPRHLPREVTRGQREREGGEEQILLITAPVQSAMRSHLVTCVIRHCQQTV